MNQKQQETDAFWVFGYGSLMWRPGFEYEEAQNARLHGWHRACCIFSTHYRGTPEKPGLVLGLDRGGSCRGRAFRIHPDHVENVRAYLNEREQITQIYEDRWVPIRLDDERRVRAWTFVVRHAHEQYAGTLSEEQAACYIAQGVGCRGTGIEYMANTLKHLDEMGIRETRLHKIMRLVKKMHPST